MACSKCGSNKPNPTCNVCGMSPSVLEIKNPDNYVIFRKVVIPASLGDESVTPPTIGKYRNALVEYQANGHTYLYSSDCMPVSLGIGSGGIITVTEFPDVAQATPGFLYININDGRARITDDNENWVEVSGGSTGTVDFNELENRPKYNGVEMTGDTNIPDFSSSIQSLSSSLSAETGDRIAADAGLQGSINALSNAMDNKVDKVAGKGLSTNDFTTAEKDKLAGIEAGAEVNVQSDWTQTNTTADDYIKNKPDVYTKTEIDAKLTSAMHYKGTVPTVADLPSGAAVGDVYNVSDTGINYAWDGTGWDELSGVTDLSNYYTKTETNSLLDNKVDKVTGKGLSTNDFTNADKTKLDGIQAGAEVNVQSDWNQTDSSADDFIKNKPTIPTVPTKTSDLTNDGSDGTSTYVEADDLATVATTGSYNDLSNKPTIPAAQIQSDWNQTNSSAVDYIKNKPNIPTGVTLYNTTGQNTDGAMTQKATTDALDGKQDNLSVSQLATVNSGLTASDKTKLDGIQAGAEVNVQSDWAQTDTTTDDYIKNKPTIPAAQVNSDWNSNSGVSQILNKPNLATVATSGDYDDLTNKPTIPSYSDFTGATSSAAGAHGLVPAPAAGDQDKVLMGDGTWETLPAPELVEMSYGESNAWAKFIAAYQAKCIVYCRASSNSNPATGAKTRKAFMAYVNNETTPTEVEFQYYRSVATHTASQQGDQVFVYKLTSANGGTWSVITRNAFTKIVAGTNMTSSYSSGTLTLNAAGGGSTYTAGNGINIANDTISIDDSVVAELSDIPTVNDATLTIQKNGTNVQTFTANQSTNATANITVPTNTSDLNNDSGFLTSIPTASVSTLGGVKVGSNLSIDANGVLSASVGNGVLDITPMLSSSYSGIEDPSFVIENAYNNHTPVVAYFDMGTFTADGAGTSNNNVVAVGRIAKNVGFSAKGYTIRFIIQQNENIDFETQEDWDRSIYSVTYRVLYGESYISPVTTSPDTAKLYSTVDDVALFDDTLVTPSNTAYVNTNSIVDGAVTTPKISDGAVTTAKIDDGAVTNDKIDWSTFSNNILYATGNLSNGALKSSWTNNVSLTLPKAGKWLLIGTTVNANRKNGATGFRARILVGSTGGNQYGRWWGAAGEVHTMVAMGIFTTSGATTAYLQARSDDTNMTNALEQGQLAAICIG